MESDRLLYSVATLFYRCCCTRHQLNAAQFARGSDGGYDQYAIKFFLRQEDFEREVSLYQDPTLRPTLPELIYASDNAAGTVCSINGMPFAPFMVVERGSSLIECASLESCVGLFWGMYALLGQAWLRGVC
jgi:hypothetical protein